MSGRADAYTGTEMLADKEAVAMELSMPEKMAGELLEDVRLLETALTQDCPGCIAEISESHRRCASLLSDTTVWLFSAFLTPLPRAALGRLSQRLYACVGAVFSVSMLLPTRGGRRMAGGEEVAGLSRMCELLAEAVGQLRKYAGRGHPAPPEPETFYAEVNKVRSAHALRLVHGDVSPHGRALENSLWEVAYCLREAYEETVCLMLESI